MSQEYFDGNRQGKIRKNQNKYEKNKVRGQILKKEDNGIRIGVDRKKKQKWQLEWMEMRLGQKTSKNRMVRDKYYDGKKSEKMKTNIRQTG